MEEAELVRGLRERREEAVRVYLERYRSLFQHCIGHFEQDPTTRDDLFQDLSWHALERLRHDSFDAEKGSFGTWLYRVAWCRCVDVKRQENSRRRMRVALAGDDWPEQIDPGARPSESAGDRELGLAVRSSLQELELEDRQLLELRIVDELTLIDIAARLEITVEQAKYRFKRAMSALRKQLLVRLPRQEFAE